MTDIGKVQMVRRKAVRVVASVLLAVSVAACGSSAEISDGDVETTTPRTETTAVSVAEPTLSTSESEETEESAGSADSGGESTESEASAAETSSESSGSFIELLREDIEGQQEYFDLNSVGGSGESALLRAGCEVFGQNTWVCPDKVDLSGADEVVCEIRGDNYRQGPFKYQGKCLSWIRESYSALSADDRGRVDSVLHGTGCESLIAQSK